MLRVGAPFLSCEFGCADPLQTSQGNTRGTRPRNKNTQQGQERQAPPESNWNQHEDQKQNPRVRNQSGNTEAQKKEFQLFLEVTSAGHAHTCASGTHAQAPTPCVQSLTFHAIAVPSSTQAASTNSCSRTSALRDWTKLSKAPCSPPLETIDVRQGHDQVRNDTCCNHLLNRRTERHL